MVIAMQINNGVGVTYVAPDGSFLNNDSNMIGVIYELTLGDMLVIMLLGMILAVLVIGRILDALWQKER